MALASLSVALEKIIKSSANKRWEIGGQFLAILMPCKLPRCSSFKMSLDKISDPRMKRNGERGSPCLRPREGMSEVVVTQKGQ